MSTTYLAHHGIKGQRWGIRRFQNADGSLTQEGYAHYAQQNMKKAKVRNLDKWGKDPNHNVLYIIGTSGSGKSTTAKGLASSNDSVIHLDTLLEKEAHKSPSFNKDFEHFLRNNGVDIDKARDATIDKKERWKAIDDIGDHVESYGKDCYNRGKRVIIEGAQMGDDTMFPDKNYFKDKPTITMKTNYIYNSIRASRRDGDKLIDTAKTVLDPKRKNWYNYINENIDKINSLSHNTLFGNEIYLAHHGIKGQRWGIRRFQNADGTLTDQGRRHYGYGSERHRKGLATENTKQRLKEGVTTGALAGIGRGVIGAASLISYASGIGAPVGMAMMAGATYLASSTTRGIITGMTIGGLYGAIETRAGREYIKEHDAGLKEFEIRDLEASKK